MTAMFFLQKGQAVQEVVEDNGVQACYTRPGSSKQADFWVAIRLEHVVVVVVVAPRFALELLIASGEGYPYLILRTLLPSNIHGAGWSARL